MVFCLFVLRGKVQEKHLPNAVARAHSLTTNVFFCLGEVPVTLSVQAWCQGLVCPREVMVRLLPT